MPQPKHKPVELLELLNPCYKGATPEMVGRALLRPVKSKDEKPEGGDASGIVGEPEVPS